MIQTSTNRIVSVIVVTRGLSGYFRQCLDSVKEQSLRAAEIIVIDNSLNKNFTQDVKNDYPDVKLYASPKNLYYCRALNMGIGMSKGDFILCLNDDVILRNDFIIEASKAFCLDTRIGMVSAKILRFDRKTIDSTGLFLTLWRTAKERGYGIKDKGLYEKEEYIFGVNGAVAFYRKAMLEQVKLGSEYFDADYDIFYEDLDIAWRAKNFGWRGYYVPGAVAYHARGGTVRQAKREGKKFARFYLSDKLNYDLIKNRYLTIIKNETLWGFLLHLPFIFIYDIFAWGYILLFRPKVLKIFFSQSLAVKSAFKKRRNIFVKVRRE